MNSANGAHSVQWAGAEIPIQLRRAKRKTLSITVRPDLSVRVSAPQSASIDSILKKVQRRSRWIIKQQRIFQDYLPTTPPRRFVAGETHRYLGRQYRLKIDEADSENVKLKGQFLRVATGNKRDSTRVKELVTAWYREHAAAAFNRSLVSARRKFPKLQSNSIKLRLRTMPKRWGSCTKSGIIFLNPELIQAPPSCIDYVITHELCHLLHPNHGRAFYNLLQTVMPDWKSRKARLEKSLI